MEKIINNHSFKIERVLKSKRTKKKSFNFFNQKGKIIKDKKTLERIKKMRIPPNYDNVKISDNPNNKIQAIGFDNKGRKQYIYNQDFINLQKNIKYEKYLILGKYLKTIEKDINKIINKIHNKPYRKWEQPSTNTSIVLYLLNNSLFRIGSYKYYNLYGSHGAITLKGEHIELNEDKKLVNIKFIGKKGVINEAHLTDTKLFNIFKTLKNKKTGYFLFDFKSNNHIYNITADDIQKYLNNYNEDIVPKMFRTWHTNCEFIKMVKDKLDYFKNLENNNQLTNKIKKGFIKETMLLISQKLHNTPTVLKNSYLDNLILDMFLNKTSKFIKILDKNRHLSKDRILILITKKLRKL